MEDEAIQVPDYEFNLCVISACHLLTATCHLSNLDGNILHAMSEMYPNIRQYNLINIICILYMQ